MSNPAEEDGQAGQPLVAHLVELRSRLLKSLGCILLVFIALFSFANEIYEFVAEPLQRFMPEGTSMIATDVTSPFLTPFKLTLYTAVFISIPVILYQVWAFVAPALYRREKRLALPLFVSSVVLFYAGMAFAYFVVFPLVFGFFTSVAPESVAVMTDIHSYLEFVIKLFFAFGLAFEIPVATVIMVAAGVISPRSLAHKRPYVIVGCFVLGMFLTPPDIFSQLLLAIPMWLLFETGIFFGRILVREENQAE